jgi:hypothetical protein
MPLEYELGGRPHEAHRTWFRGEHTNYAPGKATMRRPTAVQDYILHGWLPDEPFIAPETTLTTFGSCFASHIAKYLRKRRYNVLSSGDANVHIVRIGDGIVNTFAMRGQFEWAFRGVVPTQKLWHGKSGETYGYDEDVRLATRAMFDRTDVFILTVGLSEIWYDEPTGEVFWRAIPKEEYDPSRHKFRVSSVEENKANLRAVYDTIREFRPDAKVIFTLSPISLAATFRPVSCITANAVSKAILRAAIDELYRDVEAEGVLRYWPSYEIVTQGFEGAWTESNRRSARRSILDYVMRLFEEYYCVSAPAEPTLLAARLAAMEDVGDIPPEALEVARTGGDALAAWVDARLAEDDRELAELVLAYAQELDETADFAPLREQVAAAEPAGVR